MTSRKGRRRAYLGFNYARAGELTRFERTAMLIAFGMCVWFSYIGVTQI